MNAQHFDCVDLLSLFCLQGELQNSSSTTGEKGEDLIRVLRELTTVQRKIADLQVELQGRKVSYSDLLRLAA